MKNFLDAWQAIYGSNISLARFSSSSSSCDLNPKNGRVFMNNIVFFFFALIESLYEPPLFTHILYLLHKKIWG
jgi:hypothetical protein